MPSDRTFGGRGAAPSPRSLWVEGRVAPNHDPVPPGSHHDVLVVGAGFTGLWTALHLRDLDPGRQVTVVDAAQPGWGASGRNGGWCSAIHPVPPGDTARTHGEDVARSLQAAMNRTVDEIGGFVARNGIECAWKHAGTLTLARNEAQVARVTAEAATAVEFGAPDQARLLDRSEADGMVRVPGTLAALYSPHCATIDPFALVSGLARVATARGVAVHGGTRVVSHSPDAGRHRVVVEIDGSLTHVTADWVVIATEGFSGRLPGLRREVAPLHSYMVATEPLTDAQWDEIGWTRPFTLSDARHLVIYAQRTIDGRIAFGGRGAPYKFSSRVGPAHDSDARIHDRIVATMREMFPAAANARITHRWGGALGVRRDWSPSVVVDPRSRFAMSTGYVGDGVALSHLAASCLARGILGIDDETQELPFVGHRSPRWEPEPLRWLGINGALRTVALLDRLENRSSRLAAPVASALDRLLGW